MALLRRYGLYTVLAIGFMYMLYSLSFPYETRGSTPVNNNNNDQGQPPQRSPKYKSFDWAKIPVKNRIESLTPLPTTEPKALPKIQFEFGTEDATAKNIRETRREEVKKQFLKCWRNYRTYAWMHDEIRPISGAVTDHFGGWAATLIDALDTLYIMGFKEEFTSAIADIERIDFGYTDVDKVNVFETNIRHLGGLLASFELSGEKRLLNKAKEVGEMLYHAFDTPNHMPMTRWDFRAAGEGKPQMADEQVLLAEIGSLTMEFTRLSQLTGDPKWFDAVTRVTRLLEEQQDKTALPGMWPIVVNARTADFTHDTGFTLGSMADSTYEYFAKQYALLGGQDAIYRKLYEKAMDTASQNLLFRPSTPENSDMLMSGFARVTGDASSSNITLDPEMQHLACYTGGMFALGGKLFTNPDHVAIGRKLADTCVWAYKASPAGIMPEVSHLLPCNSTSTSTTSNCPWDPNAWHHAIRTRTSATAHEQDPLKNIANLRLPPGFTSIEDRRYILRPEAIESVFVLYRVTGEQQWQAAAWDMWTAIQRATDTEIGNSALVDVSADSPPRADSMESFWLAETLKYFYLTFSEPGLVSLDDWVFNTEAHPLRILKPSRKQPQKQNQAS
ncbi:seven-hairpin glycosidase [Decorospora gaudefroyi]|uniref:alpha-1,2-Mannosidase n=1 Tax=Decorospora gaudefroyi TaxID=184978 RepID=A0A6A5KPQ1_9PLEO|nr:seven-hairpin glycosidase [Decorospora gaudefroyi]